jgi:hypothetical protein
MLDGCRGLWKICWSAGYSPTALAVGCAPPGLRAYRGCAPLEI